MALRISHQARRRLGLGSDSIGPGGGLHVPSLHAARVLAQSLNDQLDDDVFSAGRLNALSQLERVTRALVAAYLGQQPETWRAALEALDRDLGGELEEVLELFRLEYLPPVEEPPSEGPRALAGSPGRRDSHERAHLLHELFIFYLIDSNPAAARLVGPLHQGELASRPAYTRLIGAFGGFFAERPPLAGSDLGLVDMLTLPAREFPGSLASQLSLLLDGWGELLGDESQRILVGLDVLAEEEAPRFPPGPGPAETPSFAGLDSEEENYSLDLDWMPRLVLLAKNTYVWLDQLTRSYRRPIERLDQIPEEELERFAASGFTGLWLIGLWQRSSASRRIKELMGNPDVAASAYSLFDYRISEDLGGEEALLVLKERAWRHGVRLAADMVPNHMGITSKWVMEHPDWFVSLEESPFPAYSFSGPDLSSHPEVGIYLEDHYRDRTDAAVVFKHVDRTTGAERFIYHGNDGTTMPWNDTAQLDYLNPEVREAVIQTILRVAGLFPVIRFDAAMTLARKHFQRLWYPEPGTGGAIPSRAEHGLSREQLLRWMPNEFWREVVDRVAQEAPDTLLLAEAFWLMEGYFVRTLGMHRVYNSAFMNMLRDEENEKYRGLLNETLSFDSGILKRYVNFLSNPDERTAIDQFGSDDRYFGACTVLATTPGLPMFAHGQVEGLTEKYGMEFRRPQLQEDPDTALHERHEREIFPLLRRRELFAGVENFHLFDFQSGGKEASEDVLAYGNGVEGKRTLVVFNNRFAAARGRLLRSVPRTHRQRREPGVEIGEWLGLTSSENAFCRFRDAVGQLDYLQPSRQIRRHGLELGLGAYKYRVLSDFEEIEDDGTGALARISEDAGLRGVASLEDAMLDDRRRPLIGALEEWLAGVAGHEPDPKAGTREGAENGLRAVTRELGRLGLEQARLDNWVAATLVDLGALERLPVLDRRDGWPPTRRMRHAARRLADWLESPTGARPGLEAAVLLAAAQEALPTATGSLARGLWLARALRSGGIPELEGQRAADVVRAALEDGWLSPLPPPGGGELIGMVAGWIGSERWRKLLAHSQAADRAWLGEQELEDLLLWRAAFAALSWLSAEADDAGEAEVAIAGWVDAMEILRGRAERASYRVDRILATATRA